MGDEKEIVQIIHTETGEVVKEMECWPHVTDNVIRGASINLNHDEYHIKLKSPYPEEGEPQ